MEWEYKRCAENAEDILLGRKIRNPNVQAPFSLADMVDSMLADYPRHTPEELLGTIGAILQNAWYDYYREKPKAPPPERT